MAGDGEGHSERREQLKQRQERGVWFQGRVSARGSVLLTSSVTREKMTGEDDRPMPGMAQNAGLRSVGFSKRGMEEV